MPFIGEGVGLCFVGALSLASYDETIPKQPLRTLGQSAEHATSWGQNKTRVYSFGKKPLYRSFHLSHVRTVTPRYRSRFLHSDKLVLERDLATKRLDELVLILGVLHPQRVKTITYVKYFLFLQEQIKGIIIITPTRLPCLDAIPGKMPLLPTIVTPHLVTRHCL